jgi:hypothetical protein
MSEPQTAMRRPGWLGRTMPGTSGCLLGFTRWRGWLYVGYVFAAFFLVGGVVDAGATFATANELKAALQRVKESGAPLTCAEAAPPMIPVEGNAAPLYLKVHDLIAPRLYKGSGADSPRTGMFSRPAGQPLGYGGADWSNPEDIKGLAEFLKKDARALELLDRAAVLPGCRFDIEWSKGFAMLLPHLAKVRALARFCADATAVAAAQGDAALAARRLGAGIAMARHIAREPILISQLVAYACLTYSRKSAEFALARCTVSGADARAVGALLTSLDLGAGLATAMRTERAMVLDVYDLARKRPSDLAGLMGEGDNGGLEGWAMWVYVRALPPLFNGDELAYLEFMERSLVAVTAPWAESSRMGRELESWAEKKLKRTIIARAVGPALSNIAKRRFEAQTQLNLIAGVLGLQVYHQGMGAYPESLEDLGRIDWPVPQDPFGVGALVYRPQGEGFMLYSIGPDGVDDEGKPSWKWGSHPPGEQPEDADKGDMPWQWR